MRRILVELGGVGFWLLLTWGVNGMCRMVELSGSVEFPVVELTGADYSELSYLYDNRHSISGYLRIHWGIS